LEQFALARLEQFGPASRDVGVVRRCAEVVEASYDVGGERIKQQSVLPGHRAKKPLMMPSTTLGMTAGPRRPANSATAVATSSALRPSASRKGALRVA
jgi:hypothetical protein